MSGVAILVTVLLILAMTGLAKASTYPPNTPASADGKQPALILYGAEYYSPESPPYLLNGEWGGTPQFDGTAAGGNPTAQILTSCPAPGTPSLVSPDNGQTDVSTTPTLDWSDVSGATSYAVQVCGDSGCSVVVDYVTVGSSQWIVSSVLNQGTQYWWRTRANNSCGSGSWSNVWSFTTTCVTPGTPSLVSPDNGQTDVSTTPTLDWSDVSDAISYDVEVYSDIGCSSLVRSASVYSSQWTVSPALDTGAGYYWHVRASKSCSSGSWSSEWAFTTACATPGTPSLVVPYNGQTGVSTNLTLDWSDVSGATLYDVEVCRDIGCSSVVGSASVNSSEWTVSPTLYQGRQYYWRARARNSCGFGSWSSVWSFSTCTTPGTPSLVSPENGQTGVSTTPTLDWRDVSAATSYDVEVCSGSGSSSGVWSASVNSSHWKVSPALDQGTRYYWRVKANNPCGSGFWSSVWSFTTQMQGNNPPNTLDGVWGSSSSDVFAVGYSGTILHYNGSAWSTMTSHTSYPLYAVWGSSSSDVFAVGEAGTILHYNGSVWSAMTSRTTNDLDGVWGSSSSDVFAVGKAGTIRHYNGSVWRAMISRTTNDLDGVWGSSSSDVFAVGEDGTIVHYNGSVWSSAMTSGTANVLWGVWGSSSSDVFAVGSDGTILRYDGSVWSAMTSSTANVLWGVWGSSSSDVFAVGSDGTILNYDGSAWSAMISGTSYSLYAVWASPLTDVFAVGGAGTIWRNYEATTTTVASSANPSAYGQSVTFTATVSPAACWADTPTGTVQFQIDGSDFGSAVGLVNGIATSSAIATLSIGSHTVTAVYSGNINLAGSIGALSGGQNVNQATTTTVASSANPSVYSQSVNFSAMVSAATSGAGTPTGTVQFQIDGSNFGSAVGLVDGIATSNATATLSMGSHTVTAVYSGDINFAASTGTLSGGQVVNQATTTTVVSSANPSVYGQSVNFSATVSPTISGAGTPTGVVIFKEGSTTLGSSGLSDGTATYSTSTLPVGSHFIMAVYSGDTNFAGSISSALTQTVNAAPVNWGLIGGITGGVALVIAALVYFLVIKRRARRVGHIG
jgi:hypothetical protein